MGATGKDDFAKQLTDDELAPVKRSVVIAGHTTSLTMEPVYWRQLEIIARQRRLSVATLISEIDHERSGSLSNAVRLYVLDYLKKLKLTIG